MGKSFKICFVFIVVLSFLYLNKALSVEVTIEQPPGNYRTFSLRGRSLTNLRYARNFNDFTFNIPDEHVVREQNGEVNLVASLRRWRRDTPVGQGHPRTSPQGTGYYPFQDGNGNYRYIALEHVFRNYQSRVSYTASATDQTSSLAVSSSLRPRVNPRHQSVVDETLVQDTTPTRNPHPPTYVQDDEGAGAIDDVPLNDDVFTLALDTLPENLEIFNLNNRGQLQTQRVQSSELSDLRIEIPEDHLIYDSSGSLNLLRSLEDWRRNTPIGQGHPRTDSDRIAHYPFRDDSGNYRYIALEEIYMDSPETVSGLSGDLTEVDQDILRARQLPESIDDIDPTAYAAYDGAYQNEMRQLINLYQRGDNVSCANPANGGAAMVCNCAGETMGNDFERGDDIHIGSAVEINRSVLTRYHLSNDYGVRMASYQGSIENIIEYKNSRGTAAFSWMMRSHRRCSVITNTPTNWTRNNRTCSFTGNGERAPLLNRCIKASMAALILGPNGFDMYHNPSVVNPNWYTSRMRNRGTASYGEHRFSREGFINSTRWEEFRDEHQIGNDGSVR